MACPTLRSGQPTGWPKRPDCDSRNGIAAKAGHPQNVNFAIRVSTLVSFLEANQVPFEVATTATTLSNVEIAERAEKASVQIECRK